MPTEHFFLQCAIVFVVLSRQSSSWGDNIILYAVLYVSVAEIVPSHQEASRVAILH